MIAPANVSERIRLNMGPFRSLSVGPMRVQIQTNGEEIEAAALEVGFLHRGIEKIAERTGWQGFIPYTDRIDYLASLHCNLVYALSVEVLAKITVTPRANRIRVIVSELVRISSHLYMLGFVAKVMGSEPVLMGILREREKVNNLFEILCGARLTHNYIRIGGVSCDITEGFIERAYEFIEELPKKLKDFDGILFENPIFVDRTQGLGKISREQVLRFGVTGVNARASGAGFDCRKIQPYCGYDTFRFEVPMSDAGDVLARCQMRKAEIEASIQILNQAMAAIPEGEFLIRCPKIFKVPKGESASMIESPRGAFGVFVMSGGDKTPLRLRLRTPSFAMLGLVPELLKGVEVEDCALVLSSLDIMVSEIDR